MADDKADKAGKTNAEKIAFHEAEIRRLQAEERAGAHQEYPKWVTDPKDPSRGYIVNSKEEEARSKTDKVGGLAGSQTFDLTPEEQEAKKAAKAEADKDAARGSSRLTPSHESDGKSTDKPSYKVPVKSTHKPEPPSTRAGRSKGKK